MALNLPNNTQAMNVDRLAVCLGNSAFLFQIQSSLSVSPISMDLNPRNYVLVRTLAQAAAIIVNNLFYSIIILAFFQ